MYEIQKRLPISYFGWRFRGVGRGYNSQYSHYSIMTKSTI